MASTVIKFCAILFLVAVVAELSSAQQPVTETCLLCICEAVSDCTEGRLCEGDHCGLLRISNPYWIDAGKPTLNGESPHSPDAYPNCANNPACAALSVQGYMRKFAQDCNGDGYIDCYDYMAIHKKGGYGCKETLPEDYVNVFNKCVTRVAFQIQHG